MVRKHTLRSLLLLVLVSICTAGDVVKISTTTGVLHGSKSTTLQKSLTRFLGVPYAKAPVGDLRFLPPEEMIADTVVRNSAVYAPSCYQPPHMKSVISPLLKPNQAEISEDCLYLNIFVPDVPAEEKPLPVMVWLPGEGFDYADPQQFDGSYLAVLGKVIVVTVNYRLSVFGFLSTSTKEAPGNVGLLDQRMALRWLRKNIANFGGNVDNITLFGRFTGSMSVAIQALSPLNKHEQLFHRAILQSGIPVGDWVFDKNPMNATNRLAEASNCPVTDVAETIACLRRVPSDILLETALQIPHRWRLVYDYNLIYEDALRAASKMSIPAIDFLLGINNDEGSLCTIAMSAMKSPLYQKLLEGDLTESDLKNLVDSNMVDIFKKNDHLMNKMAFHEYNDAERRLKLRESFIEFCGDVYITSHMQRFADLLALNSRGSVYMYEFAHRPSFSIHPSFIRSGHGDDVLFTLGLPFQIPDLLPEEAKLTRKAIDAITNFAKKGNPNRDSVSGESMWPRYTVASRQIMTFASSGRNLPELVKRSSHDKGVSFWHDVIPTAEHRSCPVVVPTQGTSCPPCRDEAYLGVLSSEKSFMGNFLTAPSIEYILFGLLCSSIFLFLTSTISVVFLLRARKYAISGGEFQRMR